MGLPISLKAVDVNAVTEAGNSPAAPVGTMVSRQLVCHEKYHPLLGETSRASAVHLQRLTQRDASLAPIHVNLGTIRHDLAVLLYLRLGLGVGRNREHHRDCGKDLEGRFHASVLMDDASGTRRRA